MAEQKSQITHAPITEITLPILHSWLIQAQGALRVARAEIDALNVFPVPDGDTGTNLYLTVEAACTALSEPADDLAQAAHWVGKAAILGARGNSGVIFSALLRDLMSELATSPENFAQALSHSLGRNNPYGCRTSGPRSFARHSSGGRLGEGRQRGGGCGIYLATAHPGIVGSLTRRRGS